MVPDRWEPLRKVWFVSFPAPNRCLYILIGFLLSLLFYKMNNHYSLILIRQVLQSLNHFVAFHWTPCISCTGEPSNERSTQVYHTRAEQRERITSLDLLVLICLMQPRRLLICFAARLFCKQVLFGYAPGGITCNVFCAKM